MSETHPTARVVPRRRWDPVWLLPVVALGLALLLGWRALGARGPRVHVRAAEGHGIEPGDPLVFRGIHVGEVDRVRLRDDLRGVEIRVRLVPRAAGLARAGTRFWIVRPQLGLEGVQGLETLLGARRLACLPGPEDAPRQHAFDALEDPPVPEPIDPRGLEVRLTARARAGLATGSPVLYRGVRVGTILSVGLATDASGIEARAYVRPAFVGLVRESTRFWEVGGLEVSLGWRGGLDVQMDSLQALLQGGVALATPDPPGAPVSTGHRFLVASEPEEDWLGWSPRIPLGSELLPPGASLPRPLRAVLQWQEGRFFAGKEARLGWIVPVGTGLVGPADLLEVPEEAREGTTRLELGGQRLALEGEAERTPGGLARRPLDALAADAWDESAVRLLTEPEDCLLVVGDAATSPRALLADRLIRDEEGGVFRVQEAASLDETWHGACVLSRSTGDLVGILLVEDGRARIAPVPR